MRLAVHQAHNLMPMICLFVLAFYGLSQLTTDLKISTAVIVAIIGCLYGWAWLLVRTGASTMQQLLLHVFNSADTNTPL